MKLSLPALAIVFISFLTSSASEQDLWRTLEPYFIVPSKYQGDFGDYRRIEFSNDSKTAWEDRKREIKAEWTELLGEWPELNKTPNVEIIESIQKEGYLQKKIRFEWLPRQVTTGYLLTPNRAAESKMPAVMTVFYEPETAIGLGKEDRDFALQLVREGFVCLSIGTTETTENKTYSLYYPSIENASLQPLSALACAAANGWYVLANQPEVDESRIGIVGHSYGGKWALFAGALFEKFAAVAVSDPGIVFDTLPGVNYWEPWYLGYHPKPWRKRGLITHENPAKGLYPALVAEGRDLHELHALLAGRPFFVSGGEVDPPERWKALNHLIDINRKLGLEKIVGMSNREGHSPTSESNALLVNFFKFFLQSKGE